MSASYFDLLKYAATGIASPSMTYFDKMRASTLMGGAVKTLTGILPLSFKADGKPLISWMMKGNGSQSGTPTRDNPVMPTFCGVRTGNLWGEDYTGISAQLEYVPVYVGNETVTISTTCKRTAGGACIFLLAGNVSSGASTNTNGAWAVSGSYVATTRTVQAVNGYVTIAFRFLYDGDVKVTPENADTMLNLGSTALPYEPFGWAEKITCGGQTVPVYLGQVSTVRKIRKLVLTGEEQWSMLESLNRFSISTGLSTINSVGISTHYKYQVASDGSFKHLYFNATGYLYVFDYDYTTLADFKAFLAAQYAAGNPVTVWYVLAEPTTGIVNEPLAKIGNYADELHSTDAAVTIPTSKGQNTLTVESELQPSEMTITFKG